MPYKQVYVEPEVMLDFKGVRVLYTYKDQDWEQGVQTYWYALEGWDEDMEFNIRELPNFEDTHPPYMDKEENKTTEVEEAWKEYHRNQSRVFKKILKQAINLGYLMVDHLGVGYLNYENSKTY